MIQKLHNHESSSYLPTLIKTSVPSLQTRGKRSQSFSRVLPEVQTSSHRVQKSLNTIQSTKSINPKFPTHNRKNGHNTRCVPSSLHPSTHHLTRSPRLRSPRLHPLQFTHPALIPLPHLNPPTATLSPSRAPPILHLHSPRLALHPLHHRAPPPPHHRYPNPEFRAAHNDVSDTYCVVDRREGAVDWGRGVGG